MAAIRTASRPKAQPETVFTHYYLIPGQIPKGFFGDTPPEGTAWVCRVGPGEEWHPVAVESRPEECPAKPTASRSMFDPVSD
jgi:hypothetical protein